MENAIRARRAHFFLLFWWKSDLGLSWRHLRGIMGRLGRIFWVVLAPKTPSLGPKTPPRWAQDPQENKTKIVVIRVPCSRAAQERPRALQGAPEPMGYPSWGRFLDHFFIDFRFALDLHVIGILTGSFQEFSKSNPEMKASSWKIVAATRALVSPERRQFWRFLNDKSQVKRGGGHAA